MGGKPRSSLNAKTTPSWCADRADAAERVVEIGVVERAHVDRAPGLVRHGVLDRAGVQLGRDGRHAGTRAVQLALDAQQLARERAQRRAALVGRGAGVRRHAVRGDRDPAAGLARGHDRARRRARTRGTARRPRRASTLSVYGATLRPSSSGTLCSSTTASRAARARAARARPARRARRPSCRRRRARARARPRCAAAARRRCPAAKTVSWWPSSSVRRPLVRVRARDDVQADGRGQEVDRAAGLARPVRDQRRAGVEPLAVPGRRVDRAQLAQALEIARGQRGGHAAQSRAARLGGAQQRQPAARHPRQHAPGLDAQPALEQRGVDGAEVGRDDQVLVVVEAREPGELAADAAVRAVADEQQQAAGAVVGAAASRCPRGAGRTRSRSA